MVSLQMDHSIRHQIVQVFLLFIILLIYKKIYSDDISLTLSMQLYKGHHSVTHVHS